jgi:hypothetical protein
MLVSSVLAYVAGLAPRLGIDSTDSPVFLEGSDDICFVRCSSMAETGFGFDTLIVIENKEGVCQHTILKQGMCTLPKSEFRDVSLWRRPLKDEYCDRGEDPEAVIGERVLIGFTEYSGDDFLCSASSEVALNLNE